jgi:hypothetical protein
MHSERREFNCCFGLATVVTVLLFGAIALQMKLPELDILMKRISQKFKLGTRD